MSGEAALRNEDRRRSFLWYPGLAQAGEICSFEQGTNFRYPPISWPAHNPGGLHSGDARIKRSQSTGLREFKHGTLALAFKSVGRSKPSVWHAVPRNGAGPLFEPNDCFVSLSE